ncbi:GNAT family N-acetyltransferase [Leisingera sp. JC1]|uniref:GNAT family N-acetyltransferase n=1 Tax=Leisingera sp. JC1 TaxID=1855282 RepID=UPI000803C2EF|nr:GNAT family N-acetyltransferase [Leisingera sp. JC1]OBY25510.1 hypothetical protein A9D60_21950 [Leisingera sp. JC1]
MTEQNGLVIRELAGLAELKASEDFQRLVWGADDPADNADLMLSIQHEGGLVAGAFLDDRMLGFLFGFPSSETGIQHSHRLAVHADSRGMGLGQRLKWFQREWCLARGITMVRWTYDPLRRINAALNIGRLGATAGVYHENYYGEMQGINAGIPSDRLVAEWDLASNNVSALAATGQKLVQSGPEETVKIPRNLDQLLEEDPQMALDERLRVRSALKSAFERGLRVTGFDTLQCCYRLSHR